MSGDFKPDWLAARDPYDRAALDGEAIGLVEEWARRLPLERPIRVVDLGCGTGAGLRRALGWLAGRPVDAYAVDADERLLACLAARSPDRKSELGPPSEATETGAEKGPTGSGRASAPFATPESLRVAVTPILTDLLAPLDGAGGPAEGTVDLVVAHAVADLLPLDRFADRIAALLRPGGYAHVALTYDGETDFSPTDDHDLDRRVIDAYHRHMDRALVDRPAYGGSTAGRRLAGALASAGLRVVRAAPSIWDARASDGRAGVAVLDQLIGFVVVSLSELGEPPVSEVACWEAARRAALAAGELRARVRHVDVLATRTSAPAPDAEVSAR